MIEAGHTSNDFPSVDLSSLTNLSEFAGTPDEISTRRFFLYFFLISNKVNVNIIERKY